jgi:hypothetical protein
MSPPSHLSEAEVVKVASKEIDSGRAAERKQRSDDPQTDQEIACPVRSIPYYEQDENGEPMEVPLITPCCHIFGHRCFGKWRQICEQNDQAVSCPTCRFDLHFNSDHIISPLFAFDPETCAKVRKE